MTDDIQLYVTGNFDGDVAAFERALADDDALAAQVADEARFEMLLRDAAAAAVFCPACEDVVRGERCDACGAAVRPGGYVVERVLVSNAHGRMYVARDADGTQVALKELAFVQAPTVATIEAFEREAKFLRALEHPAIPRFVASFEEGRGVHARYYLAQELVDGTALDRLDDHWYTEAEVVDVARKVLAILVYLQSLSPIVIHRDIKPANLIKRPDGSIALVDFGAAYVHGSTAGVTTIGTFGYMPVEQLAGIVDATTDCYALGASLVYLLTRQEPWRIVQEKITLDVSAPLRAWLGKLLAADPRERFPSAKDALAALDRPARVVPRRTWLRPAAIAAVTLAAAGSGVGMYHLAKSSSPEPERPVPVPPALTTLRIAMPDGVQAELFVDGQKVGTVQNNAAIPVAAGKRDIKLLGPAGARCEQDIDLRADRTTTIECVMPAAKAPERLQSDTVASFVFKEMPFPDVMREIAKTCSFNVVVPDYVDAKISLDLASVPCNQALEMLLQAHGLDYEYEPAAHVVRVGPKRALASEREEAVQRPPQDKLPAGKPVQIEGKLGIRDALRRIADGGPQINLIIPDHIDGSVTLHFINVPWEHAFAAVLEANGLGYRYREAGKIIRIGPRRELDAER